VPVVPSKDGDGPIVVLVLPFSQGTGFSRHALKSALPTAVRGRVNPDSLPFAYAPRLYFFVGGTNDRGRDPQSWRGWCHIRRAVPAPLWHFSCQVRRRSTHRQVVHVSRRCLARGAMPFWRDVTRGPDAASRRHLNGSDARRVIWPALDTTVRRPSGPTSTRRSSEIERKARTLAKESECRTIKTKTLLRLGWEVRNIIQMAASRVGSQPPSMDYMAAKRSKLPDRLIRRLLIEGKGGRDESVHMRCPGEGCCSYSRAIRRFKGCSPVLQEYSCHRNSIELGTERCAFYVI
jgi:hypothetical protein